MKYARKAVVAAAIGFAGSISTALTDGGVSFTEVVVAVITAVIAGLGVYQVTNEELPGGEA